MFVAVYELPRQVYTWWSRPSASAFLFLTKARWVGWCCLLGVFHSQPGWPTSVSSNSKWKCWYVHSNKLKESFLTDERINLSANSGGHSARISWEECPLLNFLTRWCWLAPVAHRSSRSECSCASLLLLIQPQFLPDWGRCEWLSAVCGCVCVQVTRKERISLIVMQAQWCFCIRGLSWWPPCLLNLLFMWNIAKLHHEPPQQTVSWL